MERDALFKSALTLSHEEEVIATVVPTKEISAKEMSDMISFLTFYGSSKWRVMVEDWRKKHPIKKKEFSLEEKQQNDENFEKLITEFRQIKKKKEEEKLQKTKRIEKIHRGYLAEDIDEMLKDMDYYE